MDSAKSRGADLALMRIHAYGRKPIPVTRSKSVGSKTGSKTGGRI